MTGIPGPIQGEAMRRGLTSEDAVAQRASEAGAQADLDTLELRELERAEYYPDATPASTAPATRGIVVRLRAFFRRTP